MAKEDGGRRNPAFDKQFHAPGHASREDLTWVIDQIDPDLIVPIFTESREWFADRFEDVVLAEEGVAIEFWAGGRARSIVKHHHIQNHRTEWPPLKPGRRHIYFVGHSDINRLISNPSLKYPRGTQVNYHLIVSSN
ncbi:MAG: hypothetical protein JW765_02505 [Deltaproteobacteria bacterium]|nr:hypothetical protein [Candidatus Zymogenaceae bacterium]